MNKIKVFLIPYAGASAMIYYSWKKLFPENFELCFIELSGRGSRYEIDFYKNVEEAIDEISSIIEKKIGLDNYYIFGHSMGALLAFETYYKLVNKGIRLPSHIYFSGKSAPQIISDKKKSYNLSDEKFLEAVSIYGGIPKEFYQEEVKKVFLPVLRADMKIIEDYIYLEKTHKINCDISVLYGEDDFTTPIDSIQKWSCHAGKHIHFYKFKGKHFFINDDYLKIISLIVNTKCN